MKINKIIADNFLKLNLFNVDTSTGTVHLFVGKNEAGKSSIQEAVRFALLGETLRVSKKSDYRSMIRFGAKKGTVTVVVDDIEISRDIKTSKEINDETNSVHLPDYLPYLLNAQRFAQENNDKRRSFLINLTGTKVKGDDIAVRMSAKGVDDWCIESVLPMLRSGFTAAFKEAMNRASECRVRWTEVTGCQRYGSQIAESWKPEIPEGFNQDDYLVCVKSLAEMKNIIDDLNVKKGGLVARIAEAEKAHDKKSVIFSQKALDGVSKEIKTLESDIRPLQKKERDLNDKLFSSKDKSPVECCECGALLSVDFSTDLDNGKRIAYCTKYSEITQDEMLEIRNKIFSISNDLDTKKDALSTLLREKNDLVAAKRDNEKVGHDHEDAESLRNELNAVNEKLLSLNNDYEKMNSETADLRAVAERVKNADDTEKRAHELHRSVQRWLVCVESLAPDGIPAEILSDTLKPVNIRLRKTSINTGWNQVSIDPTMEIMVDGIKYNLLSESAKWKADVTIADAIANISGIGIMLIDRMDVLDVAGRLDFMKWIELVQNEYETIFIFATMKSKPSLPGGMQSYWIENGEILIDTSPS